MSNPKDKTQIAKVRRRFITGVLLGMPPEMLRPYVTGYSDPVTESPWKDEL